MHLVGRVFLGLSLLLAMAWPAGAVTYDFQFLASGTEVGSGSLSFPDDLQTAAQIGKSDLESFSLQFGTYSYGLDQLGSLFGFSPLSDTFLGGSIYRGIQVPFSGQYVLTTSGRTVLSVGFLNFIIYYYDPPCGYIPCQPPGTYIPGYYDAVALSPDVPGYTPLYDVVFDTLSVAPVTDIPEPGSVFPLAVLLLAVMTRYGVFLGRVQPSAGSS